MSYAQTLILNSEFQPHEIVDWKEAVTRMFGGKVMILAQYDEVLAHIDGSTLRQFPELRVALQQVVGTDVGSIEIKVPAVAALRKRTKSVKSGIKFSKINVCLRDQFQCQYCGMKLPMSQLNYDHVTPRSQGGKTVWENIVLSCYPCNSRKGNRTPQEAGMPLLSVPQKPKVLPMHGPTIKIENAPEEWHDFLRVG